MLVQNNALDEQTLPHIGFLTPSSARLMCYLPHILLDIGYSYYACTCKIQTALPCFLQLEILELFNGPYFGPCTLPTLMFVGLNVCCTAR